MTLRFVSPALLPAFAAAALAPPAVAQSFGPQQVITTSADGARWVHAADLDGDGDTDVLSANQLADEIAWSENLGGGVFGPQQVITSNAIDAWGVYAADLDGDGDMDVLSASATDDKIAWYENQGGGAFGASAGRDHGRGQRPVGVRHGPRRRRGRRHLVRQRQ